VLERIARLHGLNPDFTPRGMMPKPPAPKHVLRVGDRVSRRSGSRADHEGTVIRVSSMMPRVRVRWDAGFERGYEEAGLRLVVATKGKNERRKK
jgi:hypothetical protein